MPAFSTRQRSPSQILQSIRRHPFAFFGLPFLSLIVVSSFALQHFTRTRYDLHGQKVQAMSKEEELKMDKGRKRVDIREEYYRLNSPLGSGSGGPDGRLDAAVGSGEGEESAHRTTKRRGGIDMRAVGQDEYEPVRVPRPEGMPEWGPGRGREEVPVKGKRKQDRWV